MSWDGEGVEAFEFDSFSVRTEYNPHFAFVGMVILLPAPSELNPWPISLPINRLKLLVPRLHSD